MLGGHTVHLFTSDSLALAPVQLDRRWRYIIRAYRTVLLDRENALIIHLTVVGEGCRRASEPIRCGRDGTRRRKQRNSRTQVYLAITLICFVFICGVLWSSCCQSRGRGSGSLGGEFKSSPSQKFVSRFMLHLLRVANSASLLCR